MCILISIATGMFLHTDVMYDIQFEDCNKEVKVFTVEEHNEVKVLDYNEELNIFFIKNITK